MEKEMLRSEIDSNVQWDLGKMIGSMEEFSSIMKLVESLLEEIKSMKGHIMDSSASLYQYLKKQETLDRNVDLVYVYAHMLCDSDATNVEAQQLKLKSESLMDKVSESLSFVKSEVLNTDYDLVLKYEEELEELKIIIFILSLCFVIKNMF